MYCPECGKSNPEGAKKCQYCNAELIETVNEDSKISGSLSKYAGKVKNIDIASIKTTTDSLSAHIKKKRKIIIPLSVAIILIVVAAAVIGYITSPKRVVNSYINNLINGDIDSLYDNIAMPESDFLTKELFEKSMQEYSQYIGKLSSASGFTVEESNDFGNKTDRYFKNYTVVFMSNISGTAIDSLDITVAKQDKNLFFIFPRYKVAMNGLVCSNITVRLDAPTGCVVEVDGIPLKDSSEMDSQSGTKDYVIDAIFSGEHTITVTGDLINAFEKNVHIGQDNYTISIGEYDSFYLRNSTAKELVNIAAKDMQSLYNSAISGNQLSNSGISLADDNKDISELYDNLISHVKRENGEGLKSITFSNFNAKALSDGHEVELYSDNICRIRLTYDYSYVKRAEEGGGLVEVSSSQKHSSDTFFEYIYENGGWKLRDMDYYTVSYYYD